MLRHCFLLLGLVSSMMLPAGGCRSCSSCHDYDPPVADCGSACGCHRAGSASGGYASEEYPPGEYGEFTVEPPMDEAVTEEPIGQP